ncbi:MAG TPA: rRNA adenine N-6-methyltransferase family protein [Nitrososphaerales archaeon]|nr:rRNA adenine N-6-methyltransferase family protein [Nitrososphaerales archaeon]
MKRRRLGQHYLVDDEVAERMVGYADIRPGDRVLEIGTGRGNLTTKLAVLAGSLEAYEIDTDNYAATKDALTGSRVRLHLGDGFASKHQFDVLVSSLPYSESSTFVEWLAGSDYKRAVVLLQEDFVRKLTASPGTRDYRGISALAQISARITELERVGRRAFSPAPKVTSVVTLFQPLLKVSHTEASRIGKLFSLRRRQVDSVLAELGIGRSSVRYGTRRVYALDPGEVHSLCTA